MSLESRITNFNRMTERFEAERPSPLIATHKIQSHLWQQLRFSAALYMSRCLPDKRVILDEEELLNGFVRNEKKIKNLTPNGMIVPKRHTILEYNLLVRAFAQIVESMNIGDTIVSWHVPLNLRIKFAMPNDENMKRHHPTEHIHSDSWAGESADSVTVHIPIFGDTGRNCVMFYDPPANFEEAWLGPRPTYAAGGDVAERYRKLDFITPKGNITLADFATLHASTRLPNAQVRVTIDTTFVPTRIRPQEEKEIIHPWRVNERASHHVLLNLGMGPLFVFPDDIEKKVDSEGGFKHPTNLHIMELLDDSGKTNDN